MDRFDVAAAFRQKVLDFVRANPGCSSEQVRTAFGASNNKRAAGALRNAIGGMIANEELSCEGRAKLYRARKDKVMSAAEMRDLMKARKRETLNETLHEKPAAKKKIPGITTNDSGDHPPIRNPDAIGSRGFAWGVKSGMAAFSLE